MSVPSLLDRQDATWLVSGRVALVAALADAGIGTGDEILVPALHCRAMVEPVEFLGARPVFYPLTEELEPDWAALERLRSSRSRCLVLVHFFGIPADGQRARGWCDRRDVVLIEDCAHALAGSREGVAVGAMGDYAVGSLPKFFVTFDGGLVVGRQRLVGRTSGRRLGLELRGAVAAAEAFAASRATRLAGAAGAVLRAKDLCWSGVKWLRALSGSAGETRALRAPESTEGGASLEAEWVGAPCSLASRVLVTREDVGYMAVRRRAHYARLVAHMQRLSGVRPLVPLLPDGAVPLGVPVLCADGARAADALRERGVNTWRFGEWCAVPPEETGCRMAVEVVRRGLQLPCHQGLDEPALQRIERALSEVFG